MRPRASRSSSLRSRCATALLLLSALAGPATALDVKRVDGVHRIEKTYVTTFFQGLQRREATECPTSHSLCPSSLNGGCCPSGYGCASESCFASTRAPSTCLGRVGWYGCRPEDGLGCCPDGYICQRGGSCIPPEGASHIQSCPNNYFACPSSLNYGCCRDGMGCAANACYSTNPSTYEITRTSTTTDSAGEEVVTVSVATTISTPSAPTVTPTIGVGDDDSETVMKFFPSFVAKVEPIETGSGDDDDDNGGGGGGGLTSGQIAGIVVGAIGLLVIVLVAAFIIIRHLNNVVRAVESKKGGGSETQISRSEKPKTTVTYTSEKPTPSELDDMSVDPLLIMTSPRPSHRRQDSDSEGFGVSGGVGVGLGSPCLSSPSPSTQGGYTAVPTSAGYDSAYPGNGFSYFDVAPERARHNAGQQSYHNYSNINNNNNVWPVPPRQSTDSQGTQGTAPGAAQGQGQSQGHAYARPGHGRQYSIASDTSNSDMGSPGTQTPHELDAVGFYTPELPADASVSQEEARRRSASSAVSALSGTSTLASSSAAAQAAATVGRPPPSARTNSRRRSNEGRNRSDSAAAAAANQATLSVVTEDTETSSHGQGTWDRAAAKMIARMQNRTRSPDSPAT